MNPSFQYHFYVILHKDDHEENKYCYGFNEEPQNLDHILSTTLIEEQFGSKHLCKKCAFYTQLWYDELLFEDGKKVYTYSQKAHNSKFALSQMNIVGTYKNVNHRTLQFIDPIKAKSALQRLSSQRAYKDSDIKAYDTTMEILTFVNQIYDPFVNQIYDPFVNQIYDPFVNQIYASENKSKSRSKALLFYEEYF